MKNVTPEVTPTFEELRQSLEGRIGKRVPPRTLRWWLTEVCYWVGLKDFYSQIDLDWLEYWVSFNRRCRSVAAFHRHVRELINQQEVNHA